MDIFKNYWVSLILLLCGWQISQMGEKKDIWPLELLGTVLGIIFTINLIRLYMIKKNYS